MTKKAGTDATKIVVGEQSIAMVQSETTKYSFKDFEELDKIWQLEQKRETVDSEAIRDTLAAIRSGMSKRMQATYAKSNTPATLWAELKPTKDLKNRKMDTSAEEHYKTLSIRKNQSIPDYLKAVREAEDACTAAGLTLHEGYEAQRKV
ncbi:UNVERIFIED_CONTAM: hypothetical protein HDU68_003703 [Siphonaria sp. JEL0065]|nr:hypothetical protein HDU68_003703 [Siphonaria sp. JEL0065]